jgi:hypothetical protein
MRKKYGISAEEIVAQIDMDSEITVEEIEKNRQKRKHRRKDH